MNSKTLLLAACALTLAFVSCSKDDSKDDEPAKVKHVECTMKADFYELVEIADITITYFDETGTSKSEAVTTRTWEKKFTTTKFPFKLTPTVFIKAKTGTPSKERYELGCVSKITFATALTDGKTGQSGLADRTSLATYPTANLGKFFAIYGDKDIELGGWTLSLNSDGTNIVKE